nr:anti-sigma factor [Streptomyces sp. COG21]
MPCTRCRRTSAGSSNAISLTARPAPRRYGSCPRPPPGSAWPSRRPRRASCGSGCCGRSRPYARRRRRTADPGVRAALAAPAAGPPMPWPPVSRRRPAFGGVAVWQNRVAENARQEADRAQRQNEQLAQVLSAPDAKTSSGELTGGARGTVVVSQQENRAVFLASGMAPPPSGKVYQIWFNDEGTMRSAGLMDPGASDDAVLLDGPVDRATGMGITVEPAGGSAEPTSDPVALMDFPTA